MNMEKQTDNITHSGDMPVDSTDSTVESGQPQFFAYPELTQCLDLISNLAENTKLIPLIKGQEGSGKTTLLLQLQSQSPKHWLCCRINSNPTMHPEQLYNQLAQYFNLGETDDQAKQALLIHFESLRYDGALPVIAIDDAHVLPIDTVIELLELQSLSTSKHNHLLHIILFAAPAIDDLLQTKDIQAINTQNIQTLNIPPLNPEQTTAYITKLLNCWGTLETFALTSDQIEKIARASRGLPGRIKNLLTKLPDHQTTAQKQTKNSNLADRPIALIIVGLGLISVIVALLLFQDDINTVFNKAPSTDLHIDDIIAEDKSEATQELLPLSEPKIVAVQATDEPPKIRSIEVLKPIIEIPEQNSVITTLSNAPETQAKELIQEVPILEDDKADTQLTETPEPPKTTTPPASITAPAIQEPIPTNELITDISESLSIAAETTPKPKTGLENIKQESWILSQDPTTYTLQVIGLKDKPSLYVYIKRHKLAGDLAYFKTSRNGQPWYPLLYGSYSGRAVAIAAKEELSLQLQQKDIWIRNLGAVHKEINAK